MPTPHQPTEQAFRHQFVVPCVPPIQNYLPYLEQAHRRKIFSNAGPLVRQFEQSILRKYGGTSECCVSTANATAGLSAALIAARITGPVLVPAFTFPASLGAIKAANLTPAIIDVDRRTWAVSAEILSRHLTRSRPGAVMLVAPFGINCDFAEEIALCRSHGICVVIDNAAGLGVKRHERCKDAGVFEVFSLHATKPFAVGEGGLVFAHESEQANLRQVMNFGLPRTDSTSWGFNGKLSEFHASVGLAQLEMIDAAIRHRQKFVRQYISALGCPDGRRTDPAQAPWQCFPLLLSNEKKASTLVAEAAAAGIEIRRYYRPSLSRWPNVDVPLPCENSEFLAEAMSALPIRGDGDEETMNDIVSCVQQIADRHGLLA